MVCGETHCDSPCMRRPSARSPASSAPATNLPVSVATSRRGTRVFSVYCGEEMTRACSDLNHLFLPQKQKGGTLFPHGIRVKKKERTGITKTLTSIPRHRHRLSATILPFPQKTLDIRHKEFGHVVRRRHPCPLGLFLHTLDITLHLGLAVEVLNTAVLSLPPPSSASRRANCSTPGASRRRRRTRSTMLPPLRHHGLLGLGIPEVGHGDGGGDGGRGGEVCAGELDVTSWLDVSLLARRSLLVRRRRRGERPRHPGRGAPAPRACWDGA